MNYLQKKKKEMNNIIKDYDTFLAEGFTAPFASTYNTEGMGNVSSSGAKTSFSDVSESGDQDKSGGHIVPRHMVGDSWMRPNGNLSNRAGLVHNFADYQNIKQSMTRFQIGQSVKCTHEGAESYGLTGKIIAFEDATIRWEADHSETGIGQTSRQYRCLPDHLELA